MQLTITYSYFNVNEMEIVDMYVGMLLETKLCGRKITGNDIGIITPYRRQVIFFKYLKRAISPRIIQGQHLILENLILCCLHF